MSEDFTAEMPIPQKPQRRPTLREAREAERLSVGSYYAQHRKVIDERRGQLARLGMDPTHVEALRMPPLQDDALPARGTRMPVVTVSVPENADVAETTEAPGAPLPPARKGTSGEVSRS